MSQKRQLFQTITQTYLNRVRSEPNRNAFFTKVGTEWTPITWTKHCEMVKNTSLGLMALNVNPGDKVSIISNTRLEWAIADMAILGCKAITVPVYASNTAEESAYIINHCEAEIVFVEDTKQLDKLLSIKDQLPRLKKIITFFDYNATNGKANLILSFSALMAEGAKQPNADRFEKNMLSTTAQDVFTICYTSGTTGVPKGVVLVQESLMSVINDVDNALGEFVSSKDVILGFLPISHIFGKVESMATYHFGWQVYYAESIEKLLINMGEVSPTILFAVPRVFEKAYNRIKSSIDESSPTKRKLFNWAMSAGKIYYNKIWSGQKPTLSETVQYQLAQKLVFKKVYARFGGKVRFCIAGGAPLPKEIGEFMRIIGISILEGYGLTETCAPVTVNTPRAIKFGSIGKPLKEVAIKIADDGEILVKSNKVFKEYYKSPEATREVKDADGWFHTGDIGIIDEEGFVKITDRKKDLIITSGGKNVAPQKIENLAKTHKYISQFVVHGDKRNYLTALVVLEKEDVVKYAKEHNILFSEYSELIKHPKIQALVQNVLNNVNSQLASYESVKKFKILPNDFTVESGELTPSMKIRRRFCSEKYSVELDSMYGASALS